MNEHILKVMVWLKDKDFYSQEVMEENSVAAHAAHAAGAAVFGAAVFATVYSDGDAAHWVDKFFENTGHNREEYEKEVNRRLSENCEMFIEMNGKKYKLVEVK